MKVDITAAAPKVNICRNRNSRQRGAITSELNNYCSKLATLVDLPCSIDILNLMVFIIIFSSYYAGNEK